MPIGTDQDEPPQRLPGISSNANPPKPGIVVVGKNNMPKKNCQVATCIFHQSNAFNRISTHKQAMRAAFDRCVDFHTQALT